MAWGRRFRQRFGIAARRVSVRPHVPWHWRLLAVACAGALGSGLGWAMYDRGMIFSDLGDARGRTLAQIRETAARQEEDLDALRARAAQAERQLAIEKGLRADLAREIKAIAVQNAALKEDLAFFQTLMPAGGGTRGIIVERFRLQPEDVPGLYRFRLFLVQSGGREKDFEGRLQLLVNLNEGGRTSAVTVPHEAERESRAYQLRFKFFQRVDGTFGVNPDATVQSVEVRVYERGSKVPKLVHTVNAT